MSSTLHAPARSVEWDIGVKGVYLFTQSCAIEVPRNGWISWFSGCRYKKALTFNMLVWIGCKYCMSFPGEWPPNLDWLNECGWLNIYDNIQYIDFWTQLLSSK